MRVEKEFPREQMKERLDSQEYVSDVHKSSSRWMEQRRMVFLAEDGKHYAADYEVGLTENQECQPFEDPYGGSYGETITCIEVEAYERTVRDWREVVAPENAAATPTSA